MVIKNQHIPLIAKRIVPEQLNYSSVYFARPIGFAFDAGDWIDIQFVGRELRGGKTYSIASSPLESDIRITFRHGISEFKQALQGIVPDDKLYISQYGNDYGFSLNANKASVLIAGGVGIAPFRSMLAEIQELRSKNEVTLVYLNSGSDFLFRAELDAWTAILPGLHVHYIETSGINRKKREVLIRSLIKDVSYNFYLSGPEAMVESNEHLLIDMGVPVRSIRIDSFGGY